jgi:ferredoxin-NADP reductase
MHMMVREWFYQGVHKMLALRVADVVAEAKDIVAIELRGVGDAPLPAFMPGAHLEFTLPNGCVRHYSLINDNRERDRYVVAVLRVPDSRGGSLFMHRNIAVGDELSVSMHNNFELDPHAGAYVFIAGGIGVTPIIAMVRWCVAHERPWRLFYTTRNRARTAFYETLRQLDAGRITWHFDEESNGQYLDVGTLLDTVTDGEQVYCCGPRPLMNAVRAAAAERSNRVVKFESFVAPGSELAGNAGGAESSATAQHPADQAFQIVLQRSGITLDVPVDKSVLEVLEDNGFSVPFSCREGQCGTCTQRVLAGVPDHRDYVLSDAERTANDCMQVCVSRALTPTLTLDL